MTKTRRFIACVITLCMLIGMVPMTAFAAVEVGDRPNNPSGNLVIGILDDTRADGIGEFPNEPSVTGYDYYYLQDDLSLGTWTWYLDINFSSNGGNYIDTAAFWEDPRINKNADGRAFGYYNPAGLDLAHDSFFKDGFDDVIDENTIISNWLRAEGISGADAEDYELLFYVLKYETGLSSGYHLDAKVIKKNNVTLSYDANKPLGVTADVIMPSSSSVTPETSVTVADNSTKTLSAGDLIYRFTGWNTQANGEGTGYAYGDSITVSDNIILYAQWQVTNTYTITWVNYNNERLHTDRDIAYGTKIGDDPSGYYDGPVPTRPSTSHYSYSFDEWILEEGYTYDNSVGITQNLVYKAQFDENTIAYKATVEVILNGTFDSDGNPDIGNPGSHIDIEDVAASDGSIYLRRTNGSGSYIELERETDGIYSNDAVNDGDYYIYIYSGSTYTQVGTQELTIAGADRTRYLPYYSVEYYNGGDPNELISTEYYYIGSKVDVSKVVPSRYDYVFLQWNDGENIYNPSTDLLIVNLTNIITKPYTLTAEWDNAAKVNVTVVVDHDIRTLDEIDEDDRMTIHLTSKNESTGNYNEVSDTTIPLEKSEWYDDHITGTVSSISKEALYTNLDPNKLYGAHASIPGYKLNFSEGTNGISITESDNVYDVTIYLIYDPVGYELPFTVNIDAETPPRMVPKAVDVKVTRWNEDDEVWEVIPQHTDQSVEVVIPDGEFSGTGSVHVWGFENGDTEKPYLYRIEVVRIDLGDYQLTASGSDNENYSTAASGFFPEGAYTAFVEVTGSDKTGGDLEGAHASSSYDAHGEITAEVTVHPYDVEFDPNGGQWATDPFDNISENRFTVPDLSEYVPTNTGNTFEGWYLNDAGTGEKVTEGAYIKDLQPENGKLTLFAKWKPDLTVKGKVVVELGYPCTDENRTVVVALQMRKQDGTYDVTNFTQRVTLDPVEEQNNQYAIGDYEFRNVPDIGQYRVNVIVAGGGTVVYQNENESLEPANLYNSAMYNANDFTAADLDGDNKAVVNIYMEATPFDLGYRADTSAIAEDFRPTNLKLDLRHDHRPEGQEVVYEVIKDDIVIDTFTDGVSAIATELVPQYHANGYLYDYVISVLSYNLNSELMGEDPNGWTDRHYFHYDTTDGYFPAPFSIIYNGPANYSTTPISENGTEYYQDEILTATFVPNTYTITYDLQNGVWADETHVGPAQHTWGVKTEIEHTPVRNGYVFAGWTANADNVFDAANREIPANVWQNVTLTANWKADTWKDDDVNGDKYDEGDGIADELQIAITYTSNNTEYGTVDKIFEILTLPDNTASAIATTQGGSTYFSAWTLDGTQVSTNNALDYVIENATGGSRYDFVANFGVTSSPGPGGGGSTYKLIYETNGGNDIADERHYSGKVVTLDKVPKKEGYIFEGWHLDEELTEDVTEVKMTKNITVYANWVEDNGSAGSGYDTPGSLNGDDHFAYVVGYPDGTVRPDAYIDRAEVTAIFFRLLNSDTREANLNDTNEFVDVNNGDWYNIAISTMTKLGIVKGRYLENFVPDAYITRAEFAVICARFDNSEFEVVDEFTDVSGHWAEAEIHEAAAHGWIRGYEDNSFKPDEFITRAEAMTMINRVLNRVPENTDDLLDGMIEWSDNSDPEAWYYIPVQEATNSHEYDMKNHIYEKWTALTEETDWTQYQ